MKGIGRGTPATVYLMSDADQHFAGRVDSIGYGVASEEAGFALPGGLPRIQRTLNWVHVAQRFPVRILVDHPNPELFRVGTSAVAVLQPTRGNDGARR